MFRRVLFRSEQNRECRFQHICVLAGKENPHRGAVRARTWVYLVAFFGVFLIIFAMEHLPYLQRSSVISQLDALGNALTAQPVLLLLPCAAVLLLYLGSWALSVQIYQRKEF